MIQLNNRFRDYTFVLLITVSSAFVAACGGGGGGGGGGAQPSSPLAICTDNCDTASDIDSQTRIDMLTSPQGAEPPEESQNDDDGVGSGGEFNSDTASGEESTVTYQAGTRNLMAMAPNAEANDPPIEFTLEERGDSSAVLPDDIEDADTSAAYYSFGEPTPTESSLVRSATTRQDDDVEYGYYLLENEYSVAGLYANDRLITDPTADPYFYSASIWGRATPDERVPNAGRAAFTGPVIGYCGGCDNGQTGATAESGDYLALGEVEITADFAQDQITGTMSLSAYDAAAGLTALQNAGSTSEVSPGNVLGVVDLRLEDGTITNNGFSGNVNYVSADNSANEVGVFNAIADTEADDDDGDFSGKFYGYSSREVAGVANVEKENSDASLEVAFTADPTLLAPTNLVSVVAGTGTTATATLTWDAVVDAAEYELYRDGMLVATVTVTDTAATAYTYIDNPGDTASHSYQILARNGDLESRTSELTLTGTTSVQVGTGTSTIDALTGDTFVTPEPIYASDNSRLESHWRYYPQDNEDLFISFLYRRGGTAAWYRESSAGDAGAGGFPYTDINQEYRLVARDEDAFPTDIASNALAFAGYDHWLTGTTELGNADLFALEGEYAANLGWYHSDSLHTTVGLATPVSSLPTSGSAIWRGKAIGHFIVDDPADRNARFSRVILDARGFSGGDGERYFVEGDIAVNVDFFADDIDGQTILRAYAEPEEEEDERGYFSHLVGENDGIATRDEDVVGTLNLEFDGTLNRTDSGRDHYEGFVNEIDTPVVSVFTTLYDAYYANNLMYNYFQGSLYGPNFEETAGNLQMSTCSVTPIYDDAGDFMSCTGDLHYLGVGFVTQETAGLPLSTTPVPAQGDTTTEALTKLNMDEDDLEILGTHCFNDACGNDAAFLDLYENFRDGGLEQLEVYLYDYASFGEWERWVVDADGTEFKQVGFLTLGDNQVSTLPTTGTADYVIQAGRIANLTQPDDGFFYGSGSLSANFETNEITGSMALSPIDGRRADDTGGITLAFDNGIIASDATFSGGITVSGTSGALANINTGANGQFAGAFYDDLGTYDASAAPPIEVAGTFDSVMDSEGNEWGGGFSGGKN